MCFTFLTQKSFCPYTGPQCPSTGKDTLHLEWTIHICSHGMMKLSTSWSMTCEQILVQSFLSSMTVLTTTLNFITWHPLLFWSFLITNFVPCQVLNDPSSSDIRPPGPWYPSDPPTSSLAISCHFSAKHSGCIFSFHRKSLQCTVFLIKVIEIQQQNFFYLFSHKMLENI